MMNDFLYSFQSNFPTFVYGLTGSDAPLAVRVSSILIVLSIIMAITALTLFNKNITLPYVLLLITSTLAYSLFVFVEGFGTGESTIIFLGYIVGLSILYALSKFIDKHT